MSHTPQPWIRQGEGTVLHPLTKAALTTARIETSLGFIEVLDQTNEPEENLALIIAAPKQRAALEAVQARLNGEWDNAALVEFGPLSTNTEADCLAIIRAALL